MTRWLTNGVLIGTVAALALVQGIAGLYRLADYDRGRAGALTGTHWAIAYGPPPWLVLLLIAALGLLALALLWRVSNNPTVLPRFDVVDKVFAATLLLAIWAVPAARRETPGRPSLLLVLPMLLAAAVASQGDGDAVAGALVLMFLWIGICLLVVLWTIVGTIGSLPAPGRRQALWFLSGWSVAAVAVAVWLASIWGGRMAGCTSTSLSATCWLHRYQDWFFVAPLPILLLSFIVALLYRGPIDAARLFRRTVVYGSMLMLTLFVLGITEALLGDFVRRGLPWETPPLVATGLMAVVLYPAKRVCDRGAEKLLARILRWAEQDGTSSIA